VEFWIVLLRSCSLCLVGLAIYLATAQLLGVGESAEIRKMLGGKFAHFESLLHKPF
jgi:hypothetical protein